MKNNDLEIAAQISWVYTEDLDLSTAFYRSALGFECVRDEGRARLFATADNACIGVCEAFADRVVEPRGGMISLVIDDVEECYRRLLERGIEIGQPPHRLEPFGILTFFVLDPCGYVIEFQQFLDDL